MKEFTFDLLFQLLPTVLLILGALVLPIVYTRVIRRVLDSLNGHLTQWLYILFDSYVQPTALILRSLLLYLAFAVVPFTFNGAAYSTILRLLFDLAFTFLIGLGAWRSAPICRLLLRSAQNKLDLNTNNTMGRFLKTSSGPWLASLPGLRCWTVLAFPLQVC